MQTSTRQLKPGILSTWFTPGGFKSEVQHPGVQ
jgi:hypothetical protein